jgi:meso-butanediol dehydrogenase/(S,S)-butanediol dehydrogenase/diacetyl reductase
MTTEEGEVAGRLEGKVAVITGAGSGIGRGTANVLAGEGAKLVVGDVRGEYLDALLAELPGEGHRTVTGDISEEETSVELVRTAREVGGGVDILVSNVGLMHFKEITEVTVEEFDHVMAVNARGGFLICKHAIPSMLERGGGAIVIVSSISAYRGQEFNGTSSFLYNMTKAAVRQLATSLATRYARDGIRVNAVAPGVTRTNQVRHFLPELSAEDDQAIFDAVAGLTPIGRYAQPEEIGRAILFLVSDDASYVTGETLAVDGGLMAKI